MIIKSFQISKREAEKRLSSTLQHKLRVVMKCYTINNFSINEENVEFEHKALSIKVLGLPFYNEYITKREFQEAFFKTLDL